MFSNKLYDILKFLAQVALPALSVTYAALASIWGFPYAEEIPATIMTIVLFIGALLQISTIQYKSKNS